MTDMQDFETKTFGAFEVKDADAGEVTAIVATLGVVDKDGDVLLPGSFPSSASVKMSGYGHDVVLDGATPVGKGTISVEGDKAIFRGKFFLSTTRGRESFNMVKELGGEGEWSFGYPRAVQTTAMTDEWKTKGARRLITGLRPIEASPVFVGAGVGTGTLMTKAADDAALAAQAEVEAKAAAEAKAIAEAKDREAAAYIEHRLLATGDALKKHR